MAFSAEDIVPDSPTNNFATFQAEYSIYHPTLSEGNTKITVGTGNTHQHIIGTMTFEQGKIYYFEVATPTTSADSQNFGIVGITKQLAAEVTANSQNRSLFQNIPYPKICFECRSGMIIDQTTIQDWGFSNFTDDTDSNLALSNFTTDSDKFIRDGSQATSSNPNRANTSQANTLADAAAGSITPTSGNGYVPSWTHSGNKVFGILVNFTASDYGSISFTVDGTNWSTPFTKIKLNTGISWILGAGGYSTDEWRVNCGQDPTFAGLVSSSGNAPANGIGLFYYDISSTDAVALCTANLPDFTPTVTDDVPQDYFKTVLWTGKTAGQDMISYDTTRTSIHGTNPSNIGTVYVGWKPDLVWLKIKGGDTGPHNLYDSLRVDSNNLHSILFSNNTNQENTINNGFEGFVSNGFELNENGGGGDINGATSRTYVGWCWKAGGTPSTDGKAMVDGLESTIAGDAKLDAGNITPTRMSVNTKAGFSIVKFNAGDAGDKTIPHGLDYKPDFVLLKGLDSASGWFVYHNGLSDDTKYLYLHDAFSESDLTQNSRTWGGRTFDNNVISAESAYTMLANENYIAYCWHSVEGYSKFGSYIGNGSPDGPFVFCGFRPAFVMVKNTSSTGNWIIHDSSRNNYNPSSNHLRANNSNSEDPGTEEYIDILSNGWKSRGSGINVNSSSSTTYIFMAFAEQPFKYSNAR